MSIAIRTIGLGVFVLLCLGVFVGSYLIWQSKNQDYSRCIAGSIHHRHATTMVASELLPGPTNLLSYISMSQSGMKYVVLAKYEKEFTAIAYSSKYGFGKQMFPLEYFEAPWQKLMNDLEAASHHLDAGVSNIACGYLHYSSDAMQIQLKHIGRPKDKPLNSVLLFVDNIEHLISNRRQPKGRGKIVGPEPLPEDEVNRYLTQLLNNHFFEVGLVQEER